VVDPEGLIRPWPPIRFGNRVWPPLAKEKMIVKDETGVKTNKKVIRRKIGQKSGL